MWPLGRVHVLLYFLSPVGHGLRPLDLELMQRLGDSVNIIPVISKADTFTRAELELFKLNVIVFVHKSVYVTCLGSPGAQAAHFSPDKAV